MNEIDDILDEIDDIIDDTDLSISQKEMLSDYIRDYVYEQ